MTYLFPNLRSKGANSDQKHAHSVPTKKTGSLQPKGLLPIKYKTYLFHVTNGSSHQTILTALVRGEIKTKKLIITIFPEDQPGATS